MMNKDNPIAGMIKDTRKSFKDALSKLPVKEASSLNSFMEDLNAVAVDPKLSEAEKHQKLKELSDKISSEYGININ